MKQTAVEWLVEQLSCGEFLDEELIEAANKMFEQQIIDANWEASEDTERAEQYYNETFKKK